MHAAKARTKGPAAGAKTKSFRADGALPKIRGTSEAAATAPSAFAPRASGAVRVSLPRAPALSASTAVPRADAVSAASSLLQKATGSAAVSGRATSGKKTSASASQRPLSKTARERGNGGRSGGKGSAVSGGGSRGTSVTSREARSTSKTHRSTTSRGRGRGGRGKRHGNSAIRRHQLQVIAASMEAAMEQEQAQRHSVEVEEELELESYRPVYNVLLMEIVRAQVEQVNRRQRALNEMLEAFKEEGLLGGGGNGLRDEQQVESLVERLRARLQSDAALELQALKISNSNLQHSLDEVSLAVEKKNSEMEVLRGNYARRLARTDVENEAVRAKVEATLLTSTLDVERIKRELSKRIDIACASIRTPQYNTSMESMRQLVQQVQEEVQQHHDELTKLVVSIGAKDTFFRDDADTMHSNLPSQYRTELRKLEKDQLLNLLDVLSFQEGVVDTVGKAIYVITETQHRTAVI
ncbi:hypothetical protein GH5_00434 [Leishmania sp. Ghana 2012 LV757]|uniref:hypothetical protein n=1 Tax=Leishmania sp. Ghana 2012 LV757 TaxID=2803181 RepID=UPI001B717F37|nr:hypothetical protein GH5_00434 [Leishmania sp. Ghana 2012 LV757]